MSSGRHVLMAIIHDDHAVYSIQYTVFMHINIYICRKVDVSIWGMIFSLVSLQGQYVSDSITTKFNALWLTFSLTNMTIRNTISRAEEPIIRFTCVRALASSPRLAIAHVIVDPGSLSHQTKQTTADFDF